MPRQLPAPEGQTITDLAVPGPSTLASTATVASRLAIAAAPQILSIVERLATERQKNRQQKQSGMIPDAPDEAVHLSEVEVDLSFPFVKKVTVRKATAWSKSASPPEIVIRQTSNQSSKLRRIGWLGIGAAGAALASAVAIKGSSLISPRRHVIEISGRQRD